MRQFVGTVLFAVSLVLVALQALAQDQATIAGSVHDATGAVLPGVSIEVQGPSLLAPRMAITDFAGNYSVANLPSGIYSLTFTLPGFGALVRDGIAVRGAFVAEIDIEMNVGSADETITVTGAAPLVDVKSTRHQSVLTAERVNVLPGASGIFTAAAYVPGATLGGGNANLPSVHGSDPLDGQPAIDGVRTGTQLQGRNEWQAGVGTVTNEAIVTEVIFDTSAQGVEFAQSGVRTNIIPKAGGNMFNFDVFATGTIDSFSSNNLNDNLKEQGFQFAPTKYHWSVNPASGGPILQNKLWFYGSLYTRRTNTFILDRFFDLNEPSTPDNVTVDDLRMFNPSRGSQQTIRITHQLSQRHKLTYNYMRQAISGDRNISDNFGSTSPEAAYWFSGSPTYLVNGRWTAPMTNRLLLEADFAYQRADVHTGPMDHGGEFRMAKNDQVTGAAYHSSFQNHHNQDHHRRGNASLSYVTGSHNFKTGLNWAKNFTHLQYTAPGGIFSGYFSNGFPQAVLVTGNGEDPAIVNMNCDCGIYAQDAWTIGRLTLNGGFRFDWFNGSVPGGKRTAGFFTPEVRLKDPVVEDIPNWKDTTIRFGGAYDFSGDGSTALKASYGKYVENMGTGVTSVFSPINPYSLDWRPWYDLNGDDTALYPDGTPQYDEIGAGFNDNFGTATLSTAYDPDTRRGTNIEYAAGIEHQLSPGWAISGMWHYRYYDSFRWTENLNISADDYIFAGTFIGPMDPELPDSAQGRSIDIYNAVPGTIIQTGNDLVQTAPDDWRSWNGFEVILDGELPRGGFMTASFTGGMERNNFCQSADDSPNNLANCNTTSPFRPMGKLSGALPLPWDTMISGLFQVLPGNAISATYVVTDVDFPGLYLGQGVQPSLSYNLIEPNTEFDPYRTQLNLRLSKIFRYDDIRTRIYMDASNLFNQTRVTSRNRNYGGGGIKNSEFLRILGVEQGRVLSFGLQSSF